MPAASVGHSWHVRLTKQSDATQKYAFTLAEGADGAPAVRLGSLADEMAEPGRSETIPILSLHHGSGQYLARDPMMYEWADGMLADTPGLVASCHRGYLAGGTIPSVNVTNQAADRHERTAILTALGLTVLPTGIYEANTLKLAPVADASFTGSLAVFAGRVFFGQAFRTNGISTNVAFRDTDGSYNGVGNFKASFVAAATEKMWAVNQSGAEAATFAWTDQVSTNAPSFTASYSASLGTIIDLGLVGGHAVILSSPTLRRGSYVHTLDVDGLFTPLLSNISPASLMTPFLGGQLIWLGGAPRALWMPDPNSYRMLDLPVVSSRHGQWALPRIKATPLQPAMGADSAEDEMFFSLFDSAGAGSATPGSLLAVAKLRDDGLFGHVLATPTNEPNLNAAIVTSVAITRSYDSGNAIFQKVLFYTAASANSVNSANTDFITRKLTLPEHGALQLVDDFGNGPTSYNRSIRTSRYAGSHLNTKRIGRVRGLFRAGWPGTSGGYTPGQQLTIRLFVDDSETAAAVNTIAATTTPQAFEFNAATNAVYGRRVALEAEWLSASDGLVTVSEILGSQSVILEFPWEIEYFAVPAEQDIVRLGISAALGQPDRAGTLSKDSRAAVTQQVQTIVASGADWLIDWWDGMPQWRVVPLAYSEADTEGQHIPGSGGAIIWLTCRRVA